MSPHASYVRGERPGEKLIQAQTLRPAVHLKMRCAMRSAHSEAPVALTVISARPRKIFRAHAFVALALSFAQAVHAQLPGIDAPTGATAGTGRDVAGRPAAVPDANAAAGADRNQKDRADPQKSRPGRSDAERAASSAQAVAPGSSMDKIEGTGPISRGAAVSSPGGGSEARGADRPGAPPDPSAVLNDAIKLCERLAGVEREVCLRQAEENRERAADAGVGATPGRGSTTVGGAGADDPDRGAKPSQAR
jgi:hypothetical protein